MTSEALWSKREVAVFLGVSVSWVAHNRHLLPEPCRIGHQLRWIPAEVREWASACRDSQGETSGDGAR